MTLLGTEKPKLYVMLEKDTEFLGAIQFSDEYQMRTSSLKAVRDMIQSQLARVPEDFAFLCRGKEVNRVWEVDRLAWSTVPFALHGSPGLRVHLMARNRKLEQPACANRFEFRYMGNALPRYKKRVHEISPIYRHRGFQLNSRGRTNALRSVVQWRVASNWCGEWIYGQASIQAKTKRDIQKRLRTAMRPQEGTVVVKSHLGELISPFTDDQMDRGAFDESCSDAVPAKACVPRSRLKQIPTLSLSERKSECKKRQQQIQWKARVIAMEVQHRRAELEEKENDTRHTQTVNVRKSLSDTISTASTTKTVLVHIEEDDVLPSRLVSTLPKKRKRPRKVKFSKYEWHVPSRRHPSPTVNKRKLVVKFLSEQTVLAPSACSSDGCQVGLGRFLASTNICLESDEVEVFPVLILRPIEEQVPVGLVESTSDSQGIDEAAEPTSDEKDSLNVSRSYLSEFEYELSVSESNYENLFHHIESSALQDALSLNRQDVLGRTMLHDAANFGHGNVLELLLKTRVLLNVGDSRGDTALHHAARHGRLKEVSALLRENAVVWERNNEGKSPLLCALETASRELVCHQNQFAATAGELSRHAVQLKTEESGGNSDFYTTHQKYPKLRQVIDLLWDQYPAQELSVSDIYDRNTCLVMEKEVFGDIFRACRNGNLLRVQRLIDLEKRPVQKYINDQLDTLGRTALHEATELGHTAIVDLLLKIGADGYMQDQRQQIPLHIAAAKGYERIAKVLMFKFPGTLGFQDVSGKTPLHLAVEKKHWVVATELLAAIRSHFTNSAGSLSSASSTMDQLASIVNLQDIHGYTALHYACIHGSEALCLDLLKTGAHPMISRVTYCVTRRTFGLQGVFLKRASLFRSAGVNPSVASIRKWLKSDISGGNDLEVAFDVEAPLELLMLGCKHSLSKFSACAQILDHTLSQQSVLERERTEKEMLHARVKKSRSPLFHLAAEIASVNMSVAVELCRQLSKLQLEINMVHHRTGETVLLQECKRVCATSRDEDDTATQLALVRALIELGANVNLANEVNGETPLACAAWHGHLQLLDLLLETQPDRDFFLKSYFSPLHFAAHGNRLACAKMLIVASAEVNADMSSTSDETPLFFAIRSKSAAMVKLLLDSGANVNTLCTVRSGTTSFGICLDLKKRSKPPTHARTEKLATFGSSQKLIDSAKLSTLVVSPLTFALEVARSLASFHVLGSDASPCVSQAKGYAEWDQMGRICLMLACKFGESTTTSGLISRNNIHGASLLGYWEVVKILLSHQVVLSSTSTSFTMNALHYAAAAGQTSIVSALAAAGMDVSCVLVTSSHATKLQSTSFSLPKALLSTLRNTKTTERGTLHMKVGALYFALVNGHVDTAAKLLVLGADPLKTLPYFKRPKRVPRHVNPSDEHLPRDVIEDRQAIAFFVTESMKKHLRTSHIIGRYQRRHMYKNPGIYFARHLELSINANVPLIQVEVAAGHIGIVQVLVNAGMSIFQTFRSTSTYPESEDQLGEGETAIHFAVSRGHLEMLRYFATLAQSNFPKCFLREGNKPKSLLVSACENHQLAALRFLLRSDCEESDMDGGGGFTYAENRDEFQKALCACAFHQFPEGLRLLIAHGARPDLQVLVQVLQGIVEQVTPKAVPVSRHEKNRSQEAVTSSTKIRLNSSRRYHPTAARNTVARAGDLLKAIVPFTNELDEFFLAGVSFDAFLKILIVCARCDFWFVLQKIFVTHAARFLGPASPWKPMIIRAVSCCLVLYRAALQNQVDIVRFILALGIPADLRLSEIPFVKSPIWYAASRGCLEAFVLLAVAMESQSLGCIASSLEYNNKGGQISVFFRSIQDSRSFVAPGSICKWHNLSAFSCYEVPRAQTNSFLIQKLIDYVRSEQKNPHRCNSLLHIACKRGDLLTVQVLVDGGAALAAENALKETPLLIAAERKDSYGTLIVRYLLSKLSGMKLGTTAARIDQALVRCFAQPRPCNLQIAKVLLAAGADVNFVESQENGGVAASAMHYALESVQFAGVKLLLDHGGALTIPHVKTFLKRFMMSASFGRKNWRRLAPYLAFQDQRLLEVESLMKMLLKKKHFQCAMNEDLLHQLVESASALAATIARVLGMEKKFWEVVARALDTYPDESKTRKAEWGGRTALHYAVIGLEVDIVSKLVDIGEYDVLAEDHVKQTPLHLAAMTGDVRICKLLLRKLEQESRLSGVDTVDERGRTALHIAVLHGHEAAVELLANSEASIALRCADGLNALLYACKCNRLGILMALYARDSAVSRKLLVTSAGEHGIFVAARCGAFQIVRWLISMYQDQRDPEDADNACQCVYTLRCLQQRTLLHYASMFGDEEVIRLQLQAGSSHLSDHADDIEAPLNQKDLAGYTPMLYAFGLGRVQVLQLLMDAGSNAEAIVDHSGEAKTHPYAAGFNIGTLLQWFAFPGWLSFASKHLLPSEKRRLTKEDSIFEDYLMNSGIRRWKVRKQRQTTLAQDSRASLVKRRTRVPDAPKFEKVRTSMRLWRFPQLSLFDYLCDVGDSEMVKFLVTMKLPILLRRSTYQSQRRNMLQAVRWNRMDVVQHLVTADSSTTRQLTEATQHTDGLHFTDFLEVGIDCAVARGHEEIAIYLLEQWNGIKDNGRRVTDASVFAFQFAHVLQTACIRHMIKLIKYMIARGGEQLVAFHANDGPALVYAVGFGHADVAALLAAAGAHFSSMDTYIAPSVKKWVEFGCVKEIQLLQAAPSIASRTGKTPKFVGPLAEYETPSPERLTVEMICQSFAGEKSTEVR